MSTDPYELRNDRPDDDNLVDFVENLAIHNHRLLILVGAGASYGASLCGCEALPTALQLRNEIWRAFMLAPGTTKFDPSEIGAMSLDQASAFAEAKVGRQAVVEFIELRFRIELPLWQHAVLPFLRPRAIFTTNYDDLLERGRSAHPPSYGLQEYLPIFSPGQQIGARKTPLYKPHGCINRINDTIGSGGPVITTTDYFEMLFTKHRMLDEWLSTAKDKCVLMIGFSMTDMDIAGYLYTLRQKANTIPWYAVFPRTNRSVKKYWEDKLKIMPINRRFAEFMVDVDRLILRDPNAEAIIPLEWKYETIPNWQAANIIQ